ncbi:class I lanthipeptide [Sinomicrobium pectinilyticum]|uniref:class I lanthipeptide n=1 Tax=Sinomicrobium pectinilyticum TaxID=1084421 RepID=UPI0011CE0526|nr:class I lanthipeptide [Sinomicrobium pectinilyticum]
MKKKIKKLSLNKKTISSLNLRVQNQIMGGAITEGCPNTYQMSCDDCPTDKSACSECDPGGGGNGPTDYVCPTGLYVCGT